MNYIKTLLNKDGLVFGIIVGISVFVTGIILILGLNYLVVKAASLNHGLKSDFAVLIAVALDILAMRVYFLKETTHTTAKGILFVSFILIICFFAFIKGHGILPEYFI
jgi:hypothetical protein